MDRAGPQSRVPANGRAARRARQQQIRDLVSGGGIGSQQQLADELAERGFEATQATVSRDIAELGLVKVARGDRHVYASPAELSPGRSVDDTLLLRVLADVRIEVRRSGLILLLVSTPGTASIIAEAIDRSGLDGPVGTLAGDNTVLVLFSDEARLEHWQRRLLELQAGAGSSQRNGGPR
jgi:transcriptional regulator of arginine metabolism